MKKIFTLAAAVFMAFSLNAADKTYLLEEATLTSGDNDVYEWAFSEVKCKNFTYHYVEVPAASAGSISWQCTSSNTGRFIYLYTMENEALVKQTDRKLVMNTTFAAVGELAYAAEDIVVVENANYLVFGTTDDFKAKGIRLTVTESGVAPSTDPVESAEISGATEAFVGYAVELTCTAAKANAYQWYVNGEAVEGATAKKYAFTAETEGSYSIYCTAANDYNETPVQSNTLVVVATVKPEAVACANIIPASSGTNPTEVGTEIDLDLNSDGGKIFVAGMKKTDGTSIVYNELGLGLMTGGADSVRVEFNNLIAEGSVIKIVMAAGGTSERGLNLQTASKSTVFAAKWTPAAAGEVKEFEYTVPAGSKLIGDYRILLARNNSVYLQSVQMGDCGEARDIPVDTDPVLKASKASVDMNLTAATPTPSATVTFTGKNLAAGTYNLTVPEVEGLTVNPASVTVGEDGKLSAEVTIAYASAVDVAAASANIVLTIGELSATVAVNYSAVLAKNYVTASVNIEGNIMEQGTSFATVAALEAAGWELAQVDANDSLNSSKGAARNEAYLGLKLNKSTAAYLAGWVKAGDVLRVKFGNIPDKVLVSLNNGAATEYSNAVYELNAEEDTYVKFAPKSAGSKLVIKQVMLNAAIADVLFPITYATAEHGTVSGWTIAYPGEEVKLSFTMDEGYAVASCFANDVEIVGIPDVGEFFTMPAENVTITATFADAATAIGNTNAEVKAVKVIRNGQLIIVRDGVEFNAQGAIVK